MTRAEMGTGHGRSPGLARPVLLALVLLGVAGASRGRAPEKARAPEVASAMASSPVDELLRLAREEVERAPESARERAREALDLARAAHDRAREAEARYLFADASRASSHWAEALEQFEEARRLHLAQGNRFDVGRCLRRRGDVHWLIGNSELALAAYYESLRLFEALAAEGNDKARLHLAHLSTVIGNVLHQSRNLDEAAAHYRKAVALYEELGFALGVAGARCNLGSVLQDLGQIESALEHYEAARALAEREGDTYLHTIALTNLAGAHLSSGRLPLAVALLGRSLEISRRAGRERGTLASLQKLGEAHLRGGEVQAALAAYREADGLSRELSDPTAEAQIARELSALYERLGEPGRALAELRRHAALAERLRDEARVKQLDGLRIAHEVEAKEKIIRDLERDRSAEVRLRTAVTVALLAALAVLGLLASRYRLRSRSAAEVERLSRTDDLTGLFNRRAFAERFALEQAREARTRRGLVLAVADLDLFKQVNDRHGHERGDRLLREIAGLLRAAVRAQDFVGRWGGEEFVFLLPETDLDGGARLAESLRAEIEGHRFEAGEEGEPVAMTMTLGLAAVLPGETLDRAFRRADEALYRGKLEGRNRVVAAAAAPTVPAAPAAPVTRSGAGAP